MGWFLKSNDTYVGPHYGVGKALSCYMKCSPNRSLGAAKEESAKHWHLSTREEVKIICSVPSCKPFLEFGEPFGEPPEARNEIRCQAY